MKKSIIVKSKKIKALWDKTYSIVIPILSVAFLILTNYGQNFNIIDICKNDLFGDMLTAIITSMSIVISIFGFLMPSLISAKEDKMVKYFIENADMNFFIRKIKGVIKAGILGILLSIVLYLGDDLLPNVLKILLYIWIGVGLNFVCNSYRFISIIISLLLLEKKTETSKNCINSLFSDRVDKLNSELKEF